MQRTSDESLLIHRHCHRLAHFQMAGQHLIVKVEVQCFEAVERMRIDDRIVLEPLKVLKIAWVLTEDDEAIGIQGTRLQFFEEASFSRRTNRENDLIQVRL